jgi:hypothetical protein
MQNQTIGQVQPMVHALQLALQGTAIEQGTQRSMSENCARDGRAKGALGPEWLHDLVGRTGFRLPASTKELHDPAVRCAAPLMAVAISARSESRGSGLAPASSDLVQAALALDLATWLEIASIKAGDRQS